MAVNKVVYDGETLIDLTGDSVTPATLAKGATAHDKSGKVITGTATTGTAETWVITLEDGSTVNKQVMLAK